MDVKRKSKDVQEFIHEKKEDKKRGHNLCSFKETNLT
jgi:hypothetical protein